MEIELEWYEYAMASEIGRLMQLSSIRQGLPDNYGFSGSGWNEHIEGACGELAVAKALNIYWAGGIDTFSKPDIGANLQVRTRSKDNYDLIVRPKDSDEDIFILVTGKCPKYRIRGFVKGADAKQPQWLQDYGGRPPAYFIPPNHLRPLSELLV